MQNKFKLNILVSTVIVILFLGGVFLIANKDRKENTYQIQEKKPEEAFIKNYMVSPTEINENNYYSDTLPGISFDYQAGYEVKKVAPREDCWTTEKGGRECSPDFKPYFGYLVLENLNSGFGTPMIQYWEKEKKAENSWIYLKDEQYGENKFKVYKPSDTPYSIEEADIYVLDVSKNYNLIIQYYNPINKLPIPIDLASIKFIK